MVLPAPFGPMSPTISPASTSRLTSSSAVMPAKVLVTDCAPRAGSRSAPRGRDDTRAAGLVGRRASALPLPPEPVDQPLHPRERAALLELEDALGVLGVRERAEPEQDRLRAPAAATPCGTRAARG